MLYADLFLHSVYVVSKYYTLLHKYVQLCVNLKKIETVKKKERKKEQGKGT